MAVEPAADVAPLRPPDCVGERTLEGPEPLAAVEEDSVLPEGAFETSPARGEARDAVVGGGDMKATLLKVVVVSGVPVPVPAFVPAPEGTSAAPGTEPLSALVPTLPLGPLLLVVLGRVPEVELVAVVVVAVIRSADARTIDVVGSTALVLLEDGF